MGGNGSLGLLVAKWLAARGAKKLYLISRSGKVRPDDEPSWQKLQDTPGVSVSLIPRDTSSQDAVRDFVKGFGDELAGVIHCAGVLDDKLLRNQDHESFRKVMSPKSQAALYLHLALQEYRSPANTGLFAVFSSVTSLMGNRGQTNYGAANAFLDALADFRRVQGLQGVSLQWCVARDCEPGTPARLSAL